MLFSKVLSVVNPDAGWRRCNSSYYILSYIIIYYYILLAGRMHAVNREFVYVDFDDERFLPAKMVASA